MQENYTKVIFRIEQDEDGYPPINVESVWAEPVSKNEFKIKNIPFYVKNLSLDDIVLAKPATDGMLEYVAHRVKSSHNTIRILFLDESQKDAVFKKIESLGCSWEGSNIPSLIAVDVPNSVDKSALFSFLELGVKNQLWECEESTRR